MCFIRPLQPTKCCTGWKPRPARGALSLARKSIAGSRPQKRAILTQRSRHDAPPRNDLTWRWGPSNRSYNSCPRRDWRNKRRRVDPMPNFEDTLFQLDQALQKRGLPAMDRDTLREVAQRIQHPEVRQSLQAGQLTVQ